MMLKDYGPYKTMEELKAQLSDAFIQFPGKIISVETLSNGNGAGYMIRVWWMR